MKKGEGKNWKKCKLEIEKEKFCEQAKTQKMNGMSGSAGTGGKGKLCA